MVASFGLADEVGEQLDGIACLLGVGVGDQAVLDRGLLHGGDKGVGHGCAGASLGVAAEVVALLRHWISRQAPWPSARLPYLRSSNMLSNA